MFLPVAIPHPPKPSPNDLPEVAELKRQLHWAYLQIQVLQERLRLQRIQKYGPGSEKLNGGRFRWPESNTTATRIVLSQEELALLVGGIDLVETRPRKWHRKPLVEASRESLQTA